MHSQFKNKSAVVLLSSGLDSAVNLFKAYSENKNILAITFNYGQRAAKKEIESAQKITTLLQIEHHILDVTWIKNFAGSSLIDESQNVPMGGEVQIDHLETSQKTAQSVWVPNRNGIFLNIAAGFAESSGAQFVIPGFNKEEASTFPDNSIDFMKSLDQSFAFSTSNKVKVKCYTANLDKTEIVKLALDLKMDLSLIWPCYFSLEKWCGQCESCLRFKRALKNNENNKVYNITHINQYFKVSI